jgi:hypothetical protein
MLDLWVFLILIVLVLLGDYVAKQLRRIADALEGAEKERQLERDRMNRWPENPEDVPF